MKRTKRFELIQDEYGIVTTLYDSAVKTFWGQVTLQTQQKLNLILIFYE